MKKARNFIPLHIVHLCISFLIGFFSKYLWSRWGWVRFYCTSGTWRRGRENMISLSFLRSFVFFWNECQPLAISAQVLCAFELDYFAIQSVWCRCVQLLPAGKLGISRARFRTQNSPRVAPSKPQWQRHNPLHFRRPRNFCDGRENARSASARGPTWRQVHISLSYLFLFFHQLLFFVLFLFAKNYMVYYYNDIFTYITYLFTYIHNITTMIYFSTAKGNGFFFKIRQKSLSSHIAVIEFNRQAKLLTLCIKKILIRIKVRILLWNLITELYLRGYGREVKKTRFFTIFLKTGFIIY